MDAAVSVLLSSVLTMLILIKRRVLVSVEAITSWRVTNFAALIAADSQTIADVKRTSFILMANVTIVSRNVGHVAERENVVSAQRKEYLSTVNVRQLWQEQWLVFAAH